MDIGQPCICIYFLCRSSFSVTLLFICLIGLCVLRMKVLGDSYDSVEDAIFLAAAEGREDLYVELIIKVRRPTAKRPKNHQHNVGGM